MSSNSSSSSNRSIYAGIALVVIAVVAFFLFRPADSNEQSGSPAEYLAAVEPVLQSAQTLSGSLGQEVLDAETIAAVGDLEGAWSAVRTGPGYDRSTHDDFIIVFGNFVTRMKSAGLLSARLNNDTEPLESLSPGKKTELLFVLQSLHGAETSDQLLSRRALTKDALLSRTNLVFEVTNSLAGLPALLENAVELHSSLRNQSSASE